MYVTIANVPLATTAEEKFNEAVHFFNLMVGRKNNMRLFPWFFSAFLSALRSTTFYLQKQYADDPAFQKWYEGSRQGMILDAGLKRLNDLRVESVHVQPISLLVKSGPRFHENPITTKFFEATNTTDDEGNIVWQYRIAKGDAFISAEAITDWVFEDDEKSVLKLCEEGLSKIRSLLDAWHKELDLQQ
jgi:hypothetical protein